MLWQAGILDSATPKTFVETLLYLFGLLFTLHAGNEQRSLRYGPNSQLKVKLDLECDLHYLEYTEDSSKNNQGGIDHIRYDKKAVRAYENRVKPE